MRYTYLLFVLLLLSCNASEKDLLRYQDGRQLLNLNDTNRKGEKLDRPAIMKLASDTVKVGKTYAAKLFLADKNYRLVEAFFDCKQVDNPTVDTTSHKVNGCFKGLLVHDDTIRIEFRPMIPGNMTFPQITILTKDQENIFRTMEYQLDYVVEE